MTAHRHRAIGTILIVALSGFLMGFDGSLFTGAVSFIDAEFALNEFELGWAVTSMAVASTVSIFVSGPLADRFGRRTVLRLATFVFAVSALLAALSENFATLILARLLSGFGVGAVLVTAPMYIAEISPSAWRGRMVSFNQLFIVLGTLAAFVSNYLIVRFGGAADWNWRWMLGIGVIPAIPYFFALLVVPESPRWLAMHGQLPAARRVLARITGIEQADSELEAVLVSLEHETQRAKPVLAEILSPALRGVLIIGLTVGIFQQITGISSVLSYAVVIFERAGAGANASFMQTVFVGLVNVVFTVLALLLVDRVGRRPLLMYGCIGIGAFMLLASYGFQVEDEARSSLLVLIGMLGFVASFAFSLGPGMWVLFSEIFPNRIRGLAISCVGVVNSTVCVIVQFVFPWEMKTLGGSNTFLIYGVLAFVGVALIWRVVPETRGRSLEELEEALVRRS
ncbi:MAG TPA: sugar porter family MFS transporter [Steroidobacteraceae bacterium]|nr:sugar porter family MFS transporter [Steroidobacteraceae bacterium]